jgi:hypothetical protein
MVIIRKIYIYLATIILVISFLLLPFSWFFNSYFSTPNHLESWVDNSGLYNSTLHSLDQQIDNSPILSNVPERNLIDNYVNQAVQKSLPRYYFNDQINLIIESTFNWLQGKSSRPNFKINLNQLRLTFINNLNLEDQSVINQCNNLVGAGECNSLNGFVNNITPSQLNNFGIFSFGNLNDQNINQFSETLFGNQISDQSINYQKLSYLPKDYQDLIRLRFILIVIDVVVLLLGLAILGLSLRFIRFFLKVVIISDILLLILSLFDNFIKTSLLNNNIFHQKGFGLVLENLLKFSLSGLMKTQRQFMIVYLILAVLLILSWLFFKFFKKPLTKKHKKPSTPQSSTTNNESSNRKTIDY